MAEPVSTWSKLTDDGEYSDMKLFEDEHFVIMRYNGQRCGRRDMFVRVGNYFFTKEKKRGDYIYKGRVIQCILVGQEAQNHKGQVKNVNIFELVIAKEPELLFRIKRDAYTHFGWRWNGGREHESGIIKHTLL